MLLTDLKQDLTESMKKGDRVRVETIRFLLAAVRNSAIDKYGSAGESSLTDTDVADVVKKQVKTHKESVEAFTKARRDDLVKKEQAQLTILEAYLPAQITDEELKELLAEVASSGETNFGLLMKAAMAKVGGQADGGRVSAILRQLMQQK